MEIKIVLKSILIFLRVFVSGVLKNNNAFGWTWVKWLNGHTFRTTGVSAKSDLLAVPRYWFRAVRLLFKHSYGSSISQNKTIYCQTISQEKQFSDYINAVKGVEIRDLIYRENTFFRFSVLLKIIILVFITKLAFLLFIASFFSDHRSRLGLILLQWVENTKMVLIAHQRSVKLIYFFGGYENDSCFTGLMAKATGIHLVTIPSANPIRNFYQQVVTDTFVFTADFQKVEFDKYCSMWEYSKIENWPFIEFSKLQPYVKNDGPNSKDFIGFLSRGAWLRKKRGVNAQNNNKDFEYEDRCMLALRNFLELNPQYTLIIFPHPMECHRPDLKLEAVKYYEDYYKGLKVVFYDKGLRSYQCFSEVNVTVAAISSANIERLYCGYKAMFAPLGAEIPFFSGSTLDNIVCRVESQFNNMLLDILSKDEDEYFETYELKPYRFDSIKIQH